MARKEYEDLLESTQNLGPIDEMGEEIPDTEHRKARKADDPGERDEEEVDFIPGITAGEDLAMNMQETLDTWIDNQKEYHGEDKVADLLSNPDFIDTVVENVTTMMASLGTSKPKIDEEPPTESKVDEEEIGNDDKFDPDQSNDHRIDGLVNLDDLKHFKDLAQDIVEDVVLEGLDEEAVLSWLKQHLDDVAIGSSKDRGREFPKSE